MPLSDAMVAARAALAADPEGALPLGARKGLWRELAALSHEGTAYRRRVALNTACVRRVADIWTRRFPAQELETMFDLAKQVVAGAIEEAAAELVRDRFYLEVVDNRKYGADPSPMFVGHAAAGTVTDASIADLSDAMPSVDNDEALDPESYQPSYMAASAAAGGLNGRPADAAARRAFWSWYIDVVIPAVYRL